MQINQDLAKVQQKLLNSRVVGARQSFQIFRRNAWFLENNRALSKFLYGILHYLISIIKLYRACTPSPPAWGGWLKILEKFLLGGVRNFYFGIFGITNLIYFRDIWKTHLLSSDRISFSMAIWWKCLEHSVVFPVNLFWSNLHLMFPPLPFSWNSRVWSFFSSILGIETFFGRF